MLKLKTAALLLIPGLAAGTAAAVMAASRGETREATIIQVVTAFILLTILSFIMNRAERGATSRRLTQLSPRRRRVAAILAGLITLLTVTTSFWIMGVTLILSLIIAAGAASIMFYVLNKEMPPEK